jgi:hypothetical protein
MPGGINRRSSPGSGLMGEQQCRHRYEPNDTRFVAGRRRFTALARTQRNVMLAALACTNVAFK